MRIRAVYTEKAGAFVEHQRNKEFFIESWWQERKH